MKRVYGLAILLVVLSVVIAVVVARVNLTEILQPPPKPREYTASDTRIEARVGETFVIVLESNRTTGYSWELKMPLNEKVAKFVNSEYVSRGVGFPGIGGEQRWTFRGAGAGTASITLEYMRPWEINVAPAKTQTYAVSVR